jgi:hypothetical protein
MDGGDQGHRYGRRRWDTSAVAARAAPRGWPDFRSELPEVLRLGFAWPKTVRGHRGFLPRVQCGGGWPQGGCRRRFGLLELRRRRTAHPRFSGPRNWFPRFLTLSSRSYPVQLLREATNLVTAAFALSSRV